MTVIKVMEGHCAVLKLRPGSMVSSVGVVTLKLPVGVVTAVSDGNMSVVVVSGGSVGVMVVSNSTVGVVVVFGGGVGVVRMVSGGQLEPSVKKVTSEMWVQLEPLGDVYSTPRNP